MSHLIHSVLKATKIAKKKYFSRIINKYLSNVQNANIKNLRKQNLFSHQYMPKESSKKEEEETE